jgi:hypothetical protein
MHAYVLMTNHVHLLLTPAGRPLDAAGAHRGEPPLCPAHRSHLWWHRHPVR